MNDQMNCETLYIEYIQLKKIVDKDFMPHQNYPGRTIKPPLLTVEQMERYQKIKKELRATIKKSKKYLNLKPEELFEIEND